MNTTDYGEAIERHKKLAGELRDNRLYSAAVLEYARILDIEGIEKKTRANVNYLMARIYFEHLLDYEQAAAHYVRAQTLDPDASFSDEVGRKLVASLEKMGNIVDARRQLDQVANLDAGPRDDKDVAVARIGGVPFYMSEITDRIQALPVEVQQRYLSREAKIEFVHQQVGLELIYHAAVRENYGDDPEVKRRQHLFYKQLLVDRYVVDKVIPQVQIDNSDVHNYYLANKTARYQNAPFDSVRAQAFMDYQSEKTQSAFGDYINRLAQTERVEFLDHNVK
ncbi:MAG: hypothetical protein KOO62_11820 [candidate division Zixibacteria bacterium]|nr:hypothetical protein [candidate division Zixibacteria bacterium]